MHDLVSYIGSLRQSINSGVRRINFIDLGIILIGVGLAILIRLPLLEFKSSDFFNSLKPWYLTIQSMGFSAFKTNFTTYNPPYLYLLYIIARLFPDIDKVLAIKIPSLITDFICGYFVYCIVHIRYKNRIAPLFAGMAVLFAPTVVLNSAFWGQADSIFTAGILACIYFIMVEKYGWAFFSFAISLTFKLQTIFLAPLLIVLVLKNKISWKYLLFIPIILILALVPAWLAGRPIIELLGIYTYQASQFQLLTMNAASIYSWFPTTNRVFNLFYFPGVIAGAIVAFMLFLIAYKSPHKINRSSILDLALLAMLVIPFFLPKMHERYFYPADIISIAFAFYYPQYFYLPLLVGAASFLSYQSFLFGSDLAPLPDLTLVLLIAISILVYHSIYQLYSPMDSRNGDPPQDQSKINSNMKPQNLMDQDNESD
jgi:Gpi18-like mannosyltransferase